MPSQDSTSGAESAVGRSVRLELPWPPAELNPNRARRLHWAARARVAAEYKRAAFVAGRGTLPWTWHAPLSAPVVADLCFLAPDRRKRDEDNLLASLKPVWDGMVDAGLLAGDHLAVFRIGKREYGVCKEEPHIIVVLREAW